MTDSILYQVQCALITAQHCTAQHIAKQSRTASASSESVNLQLSSRISGGERDECVTSCLHSSPESRDNVAYNRTVFALCSFYWQTTHSLSCVGPSLEDCAPRRTTAQDRGQRLSIPTEQVYGRNAVHYLQSGVLYYLSILEQTDRQTKVCIQSHETTYETHATSLIFESELYKTARHLPL